jgi:hypothetical protein
VEEVEMILDGLRGVAVGELPPQVRRDMVRVDPVDPALAEERREVTVEITAVVLDRGSLALHHRLEMVDVVLSRLPNRPPLLARGHDVLEHLSP